MLGGLRNAAAGESTPEAIFVIRKLFWKHKARTWDVSYMKKESPKKRYHSVCSNTSARESLGYAYLKKKKLIKTGKRWISAFYFTPIFHFTLEILTKEL